MEILKGEFALERENIRVDSNGYMVDTEHPKIFGSKNDNIYIKTDFAESQIELITPVFKSIEGAYNFMDNLQKIVSLNLDNEYLWVQSNPPILPLDENDITIAQYGDERTDYREYLAKKYGTRKSVLSGMHFNFSFQRSALKSLCKTLDHDKVLALYLKLNKYITKYNWLFVYLTGASPKFHESFKDKQGKPNRDTFFSCRNSEYGYKNLKDYILDYTSVENYTNSINKLIEQGEIAKASELYMPARLKEGYRICNGDSKVPYIELRFIDLNPLYPLGVNKNDLHLIHLMLVYFAMQDDFNFDEEMQRRAYHNRNQVALYGNVNILNDRNITVKVEEEALKLIRLVEKLGFVEGFYKDILQDAKHKLQDVTETYSYIIAAGVERKGFINYHMQKAKLYLDRAKRTEFTLKGYEHLQLSTQCLLGSIIKKGLNYRILDHAQNFIYVENNGHEEYIKEATRTSADSYSTVLVMENKHVTKFVLNKNDVKTPKGVAIESVGEGIEYYYDEVKGMPVVVKPNNTNFGVGINILNIGYSFEDYKMALETAFLEDSVVLVEEFITGKEYRFLVIGDNVEGVLHRRGANVIGDGESTIRELVAMKNDNPLRSTGYQAPFIEIQCGEFESEFLRKQGFSFGTVPRAKERIFLRGNSNVSTGGDALDFTDDVHDSFKQLAVKAAKSVNAKICGVDIIIGDISEPAGESNHAVIELNFNPAIDMHCFPTEGKKRSVGDKVLKLLFDKED